jgi:2-polyprenyl-3-methyl-5-hydroxy-6-metoxy-1,4-benzoquinol methylase
MKEEEIRPQKIFNEFLRLAKEDTETYFRAAERQSGACPACGGNGVTAFVKEGFAYEICASCHSLFVNPRPVAEAFSKYYTESPSSKYWASTFYKETADARREKLWKPKVQMVRNIAKQYAADRHDVVDIGGGYGIFAEEYEKISGKKVVVIEPGPSLAQVCREKGLLVIESFLENVRKEQLGVNPKVFVSFELFEHLHDPQKFLSYLFKLMNSGDLFIFTTLSGVGADIQALWEDSKSVSPPHHLNFINPKAARILLESLGFNVLESCTPGKLDIDILCRQPALIKDRFWRTFAAQSTDQEKQSMQIYLADNGLSSHMLVVAQKPNR